MDCCWFVRGTVTRHSFLRLVTLDDGHFRLHCDTELSVDKKFNSGFYTVNWDPAVGSDCAVTLVRSSLSARIEPYRALACLQHDRPPITPASEEVVQPFNASTQAYCTKSACVDARSVAMQNMSLFDTLHHHHRQLLGVSKSDNNNSAYRAAAARFVSQAEQAKRGPSPWLSHHDNVDILARTCAVLLVFSEAKQSGASQDGVSEFLGVCCCCYSSFLGRPFV